MAKKGKRASILFLSAAILAALVLAYFLISPLFKEKEEVVEDTEIYVININPNNATFLEYTYSGETVSFERNGTGGNWLLEADSDFPLNQSKLDAMVNSLSALSAERIISKDEVDDTVTGLDKPTYVMSIKSGESLKKVSVGNYNEHTSQYYLSLEGDDNIYMISSGMPEKFTYKLLELMQYENIPELSSSNVTSYTITYPDGRVETVEDEEKISRLSSLYVSGCSVFKPDDVTLEYSLLSDKDAIILTVPYTVSEQVESGDVSTNLTKDEVFTMRIGGLDDSDDTKRLIQFGSVPAIYTTANSAIETIIGQ